MDFLQENIWLCVFFRYFLHIATDCPVSAYQSIYLSIYLFSLFVLSSIHSSFIHLFIHSFVYQPIYLVIYTFILLTGLIFGLILIITLAIFPSFLADVKIFLRSNSESTLIKHPSLTASSTSHAVFPVPLNTMCEGSNPERRASCISCPLTVTAEHPPERRRDRSWKRTRGSV